MITELILKITGYVVLIGSSLCAFFTIAGIGLGIDSFYEYFLNTLFTMISIVAILLLIFAWIVVINI